METKTCTTCGTEKTISEFYKQSKKKDGLCPICKTCVKQQHKAYNIKNKEAVKKLKADYNLANKAHLKEVARQYYQTHKQEFYERQAKWTKENPEKARASSKKYVSSVKGINKRREYQKARLKIDASYKFVRNLRSQLNKIMRRNSTVKVTGSMQLVGCSSQALLKHLEDQFTEGMSLDNYGYYGWHIDHIRPCASFELTDPEQQKQCSHYTNLQPLWWYDNFSKGAQWEGERYG